MKKITRTTLAIIMAASLAPLSASADTLLGVYIGAQGWSMQSDGTFGSDTIDQAEFALDKETQGSVYIALEHPIPLVPNVKIKHNQMSTQGKTLIDSTFKFGGEIYNTNTSLTTETDLTNTDFIFYYELLDNDLVSLDFGLNVKRFDGQFDVVNLDQAQASSESFTGFVPMAYGAVKFTVPMLDIEIFADGSMLSVGDHSLYDYEIGVAYTFIDNLAVDLTFQLGYRSIQLELDDLDDIHADLEFDGIFAGIEAHF